MIEIVRIGPALIVGMLLLASPALAKEKPFPNQDGSETPTPASANAVAANSQGPLGALADLFASDFDAAEKLATSTTIQDPNGAACWAAFKPFGEVLKAHPGVFTGKLATDIEAKRLAVIAARALCNNVSCRTVFVEEASMAQGFVKNLPISVSANATPIDVFAQGCAAIPTLQVTAATTTAPVATPGGPAILTPTGN